MPSPSPTHGAEWQRGPNASSMADEAGLLECTYEDCEATDRWPWHLDRLWAIHDLVQKAAEVPATVAAGAAHLIDDSWLCCRRT